MARHMVTKACALWLLVGCGGSAAHPDGPAAGDDGGSGGPAKDAGGVDVPGHTPGMPGLGGFAHGFYSVGSTTAATISTPAMTTQPSGSTIVVGVGRGNGNLFDPASALPTDSNGNSPYQKLGVHPFAHPYEESGTALYAFPAAQGGAGFQVTTTTGKNTTGNSDEISLFAVEVIEGSTLVGPVWNEVTSGSPVTSLDIKTTAPSTLIAFWWGELATNKMQTVNTGGDFFVIDSVLLGDNAVQGAVAVMNATAPGTYHVTWTSNPIQGAQLWLMAVQ